jgi:hypothetical protein
MRRRSSIINNTQYAAETVNAEKFTDPIYAPNAEHVVYFTVASAASSPTGTTLQIQVSLSGSTWVDVGTATSVTGNGNFTVFLSQAQSSFMWYRLKYTRASGSYVATTQAVFKGEDL